MKLLYIANIRLPTEKAHGVQIMKMCEAFSGLGYGVELVVPRRLNKIKDDPFSFYGTKRSFTIRRLPVPDLIAFGPVGFFAETLSFSLVALSYVIFKKNAVLYTRDEGVAYLLSLLGKTIFWETHTQSRNRMTGTTLRRVAGIITLTQASKEYYKKEFGVSDGKILVAADGVDVDFFSVKKTQIEARRELELPADKKLIGYIGKYKTMGEGKGVDEIVEAVASLRKEIPDAVVMVVGLDKNEMKELASACDMKGIGAKERIFVSHVPLATIPLYLKACDVLVMNYPNTPHYARFMSPLKLFEYMASSVPIVTSDLPSIREVLDETTAAFVKPGDVRDLSRGIKLVLQDKNHAAALAIAARVTVDGYSWRRRAGSIMRFIGSAKLF